MGYNKKEAGIEGRLFRSLQNKINLMANITIYSTPSCIYCKMAKEYLKSKNIPFTDLDVATDEKAREEMIHKTGQLGVPVIDVDGSIIVGFDKGHLQKLLNL